MKKRKITAKGFVSESGQLMLPRLVLQGVAAEFQGRELFVTFEDAATIRTPNQNGYYWAGIVEPITERFNDLGERFDTGKVHEILKFMFLKVTVFSESTGEVLVEYVRSTSDLKVYEFAFYMEDCIRYAAETLQLVIEPPKARRSDYIFPIFPGKKEAREKYVERIKSYVEDIYDIEHLRRYFGQNPDWETDSEVKNLFTVRKAQIRLLRAG